MKKISIKGKVVKKQIEGGFWGIVDEQGGEWLPVNFPPQLMHEGKSVDITAKEVDAATMIMWGRPIKILSFHT